jgi:hypothetical protein
MSAFFTTATSPGPSGSNEKVQSMNKISLFTPLDEDSLLWKNCTRTSLLLHLPGFSGTLKQ